MCERGGITSTGFLPVVEADVSICVKWLGLSSRLHPFISIKPCVIISTVVRHITAQVDGGRFAEDGRSDASGFWA